MPSVLLEIPYEGDHCAPCVYMLETAEEAMAAFGDRVKLDLLYLRRKDSALRYKTLSLKMGKPAPIPSLFINGKMYFDYIPPVEEVQEKIRGILASGD